MSVFCEYVLTEKKLEVGEQVSSKELKCK